MVTPTPSAPPMQKQFVLQLDNGLTLVAEQLANVRSAAMTLLVKAGSANDPAQASGSANVLSDWIMRGAGKRDNRALTDYLDSLGIHRSTAADTVFMRFSASMLADNLPAVLEVYADVVQRPHLPETGFAPARDLAIQQIDAIEDEPSQKLNLLLKARHFPDPFGRPTVGDRAHLTALTAEALHTDYQKRFTPKQAILAVAGAIDFATVADLVRKHFGSWKPTEPVELPVHKAPRGAMHIAQQTNQVQIGLAYDTVPESDPDSIAVQLAVGVLSGGMGARLFSQIREKQGLCYAIHAGYSSLKTQGAIFGYSGTAPDRAQQTLDAFLFELDKITKGAEADELQRAKTGMKSRVIMNGESSAARAGAIAHDFYHYGRPRSLDELRQKIEEVSLEKLNEFLARRGSPAKTIVTIGPAPLKVPAQTLS
ncbi:MAG TPA: pitrilysin family protein [Phycisphaerae bacterium]|nr:pitrilysin family protein [Phycisphaerae bacterium]